MGYFKETWKGFEWWIEKLCLNIMFLHSQGVSPLQVGQATTTHSSPCHKRLPCAQLQVWLNDLHEKLCVCVFFLSSRFIRPVLHLNTARHASECLQSRIKPSSCCCSGMDDGKGAKHETKLMACRLIRADNFLNITPTHTQTNTHASQLAQLGGGGNACRLWNVCSAAAAAPLKD